MGKAAPAFIVKLFEVVSDARTDDIICWSPCMTQVYITNILLFERTVLLKHFNKNFKSFFRQLALYEFTRTSDGRKTRGKGLDIPCTFQHENFTPLRPRDIHRCNNYGYIPVARRIRAAHSEIQTSRANTQAPEFFLGDDED